ncbi:MAG: FAD-dependent monooxygenase [Burkholderiaceae bacterium]
MSKSMRVGIVGAGIGGVALARALRLRGIEAWLVDRAQ